MQDSCNVKEVVRMYSRSYKMCSLVLVIVLGLAVSADGQDLTWTDPVPLNSNAATDSGGDFQPLVAGDGAGNWVAVWRSDDDLGGTIGEDDDILVARSTENGVTWTDPAALNTNAATDSGADGYAGLALTTDGLGNWVAAWASSENLGGIMGYDDDIFVARSTDNGATWTDPAPLNTNAATDSGADGGPSIATDGAGIWFAVWHSWDDLGGTIGQDGDILVSGSTDSGATWTDPEPLNSNAETDSGLDNWPQIASEGLGNWVVVWHSYDDLDGTIDDDGDIMASWSGEDGASWRDVAPLNADADIDLRADAFPSIATDGAHWVAVWSSGDNGASTELGIMVARSADGATTWSEPALLAAVPWLGGQPVVVTDGLGNWLVLWHSEDDLGGTIGTDGDIIIARSTNNGITWTTPVPLNTNAATDSGYDGRPHLATDGAGDWVAVWGSTDDLGGTIGTDDDILVAWRTGDVDWDGLLDEVETDTCVYVDETDTGTDPNDPDSDDDQMPDGWEVENDLDPNDDTGDNGADGDPDGDGYTNLEEYEGGSDPQTDTDPDPSEPDSDDDEMPDGWEVENDLDPNDSTGDNGADGDPDGDGHTNLEEYDGGSDPQDETSLPAAPPEAEFAASPTAGDEPLTVQFTDLSTGAVTNWSWDFGDGGTSTQQNPSYTYDYAGYYDVRLTTTGPAGSDTETKAEYIHVSSRQQGMVAHFAASPMRGSRPLVVDFTDLSAQTAGLWSWDFGDGYASSEQNPSHTYYFTGDYTVTLGLPRPGRPGDSETRTIRVRQAPPAEGLTYRVVIDGVKVTYTKPTCFACYNHLQDSLLIAVWGDEPGVLTVVAKEDAPLYWDDSCDIVIDAVDTYIKKVNLKGREETQLYVCGQVGYVKNFILKDGYVGNTLHYGEDFGLGSDTMDPPKKVLIKRGASTAPVLGVPYSNTSFIPARLRDALTIVRAPVEAEPRLLELPFDYEDEDVDDEDVKLAELEFAEVEARVETKAAYVAEIYGVKVRYTKPGCEAFYNDTDGTLTIQITDTGGDLLVKCGEEAYVAWGDYCDLLISAPDASINTMILKGNLETQLHVVGNIGYVKNLKLKYGCVGDTEFYGRETGLGCTSLEVPNKILIKWGWTTAPVLGVSY